MAEWWQPTFQTTIDAYYQGDITAGMHACERLLSLDMLPPNIEQQTRRNLAFYLPTLRELGLLRATRRIVFPVPDDWTLFNPSIAAGPDHGQLTAIVRSANYTVSPTMDYTVHAADGLYRTTNYLLTLSLDLEPLTIQEIDDRAIRADPPRFLVTGFEDCRLVRHRDAWFATATARDQNAQGICQVAFFRLDGAVASDLHLLNSADDGRHEKNWMPVAPGDDTSTLRVIYRCSPTVILRVDEDAGAVTPDISHPGLPLAREFSGGTQAIPVDGGHLALVHESATFDDRGRVYSHRFVWFDADWRLARLSPPFLLRERGVEFAAGLTQQGDDLIISHGLWDREAWLSTVPLSAVLSLLAPPLDPGQIAAEMRDSLEITPAPVPTRRSPITHHPSPIPRLLFRPPSAAITARSSAMPCAASSTGSIGVC